MAIPFPEPAFDRFHLGTPAHGVALAITFLLVVGLFFWRPSERARRITRHALAFTLIGADVGWHVWFLLTGQWSIQAMLPLQLCALVTYLSAFMLWTRRYWLYELCYFFGLGGSSQALFTPDIPYDFPSPRFFLNFIGHGAMVLAAIYMTTVEGFRPTWRSVRFAALSLLAYGIPILFLNMWIGSNYLFIGKKPDSATPLDLLPDWPAYVPILGALVILFCVVLYLPFALADRLRARRGGAELAR